MKRNNPKTKAQKIATVIGVGTKVAGDIHFAGGLHVDGTIVGNVLADQDEESALTLSEQGTIEGELRVPNIVVNGTVNGDVYGSKTVELAQNARVTGTVYYNLLEMAMGAEINGQLIHTKELPQRRLGYDGGGKPQATKSQESKEEKPAAAGAQATAQKPVGAGAKKV
jgi:cytoskeletal protein CcmA (bactofilin family)